jgi:hypothetical protein
MLYALMVNKAGTTILTKPAVLAGRAKKDFLVVLDYPGTK